MSSTVNLVVTFYVGLANNQPFRQPIADQWLTENPEAVWLDLDDRSDAYYLEKALQLIKSADKIQVLLDLKPVLPDQPVPNLRRLLDALWQKKTVLELTVLGECPPYSAMIGKLGK